MFTFKIDESYSENALGVSLTQDNCIIGIFNDKFPADWNVSVRLKVIMLLVFYHRHHVLEYFCANFEGVHLRAVLKQSLTSKFGYLLKVHMLYSIS